MTEDATRTWNELPILLTVEEVTSVLRVSYRTTLRIIKRGDLRARKVGREYRVNRRDLMRYLGLDPENQAEAGDD